MSKCHLALLAVLSAACGRVDETRASVEAAALVQSTLCSPALCPVGFEWANSETTSYYGISNENRDTSCGAANDGDAGFNPNNDLLDEYSGVSGSNLVPKPTFDGAGCVYAGAVAVPPYHVSSAVASSRRTFAVTGNWPGFCTRYPDLGPIIEPWPFAFRLVVRDCSALSLDLDGDGVTDLSGSGTNVTQHDMCPGTRQGCQVGADGCPYDGDSDGTCDSLDACPDLAASTSNGCPSTMSVALLGTGTGTVVSSPAGINCGTSCAATLPYGWNATLTATAATGSTFVGYSGDCSGTGCTLMMTMPRSVGAAFSNSCKAPGCVCGEASCVSIAGRAPSRYTGPDCTGDEWSVTTTQGQPISWDGLGIAGATAVMNSSLTWESFRDVTGACVRSLLPAGLYLSAPVESSTLPRYAQRIYRAKPSASPPAPACGDGVCSGETCSTCARDCGTCATCSGTAGQWAACRGNGCAVCAEKLAAYPRYFVNHPACVPNGNCGGLYYTCNSNCPAPTAADQ